MNKEKITDDELSAKFAMRDIHAALENYDIHDALVLIAKGEGYEGFIIGSPAVLARVLKEGSENDYIQADMVNNFIGKVKQF